MADLAEIWNGRLFGTNTGNVGAQLHTEGTTVKGEIRFLDDLFGPVVYTLEGSWDGNLLQLSGQGVSQNPDITLGEVALEGSLANDGKLVGRWKSTLGTGGSFTLYPGPESGSVTVKDADPAPEELHSTQERLGAIRLYRQDVVDLIELVLSDLSAERLVVNFKNGPTHTVLWSDIFLATIKADNIRFLKLSINDAAPGGSSRMVMVEFGHIYNEVTVQGESQVWVAGKANVLRDFLTKRQSHLVTQFKLWNVNITTLVVLVMIVVMPIFTSLIARAGVAVAVAIALMSLNWFHTRFIPASIASMGDRRPSLLRFWPQWVSWLAGIISALIVIKAGALIEVAAKPDAPIPQARPASSPPSSSP